MPNVHGVKHEMKYSYGTFEIPVPEEERPAVETKLLQQLDLPYTAVYFKIVHN